MITFLESNNPVASASLAVDVPAGSVGDQLIAAISVRTSGTGVMGFPATIGDWVLTETDTYFEIVSFGIYHKVATGTAAETLNVTMNREGVAVHHCYRISGADTPVFSASAVQAQESGQDSVQPPSLDTGASDGNVFVFGASGRQRVLFTDWSGSSSYTYQSGTSIANGSNQGTSIGTGHKVKSQQVEQPPLLTTGNLEALIAYTVFVPDLGPTVTVTPGDLPLTPGGTISGSYSNYATVPTTLTVSDGTNTITIASPTISDNGDGTGTFSGTMPALPASGTASLILFGDVTVELS